MARIIKAWLADNGKPFRFRDVCPKCGAIGYMHASAAPLSGWDLGTITIYERCDACGWKQSQVGKQAPRTQRAVI